MRTDPGSAGPARGRAWRHANPWVATGLILAVILPLFVLGLGDRNIWIPLEARYALVAREMWEGGHWILPRLGGRVYSDKPPLFFWAIALVSALGSGFTEWTVRLPSAVAAVLTCLVTWRIGARLFSPDAGLVAALVLATSAGFFWSGREALPDMLLTLWITGACWALWEWQVERKRVGAAIAGLCMGLATLTKGPVGFLLPMLTALLYRLVRRDWREVPCREVLVCVASFLVTALAWYLPAVHYGGLTYARETLLHHSVERYFRAWEHTAPFYFYLGAFPAEFMPWTLFLLPAFIAGAVRPDREDVRGWWFAVGWLITTLLFFSASTGKRDVYMLPAFPAAALLVGWVWSRWWAGVSGGIGSWGMVIPALLLALGSWGVAAGLWSGARAPSKGSLLLPTTPEARLWAVLLLGLAGLLLAGAAITRQPGWLFGCVVGCAWVAMLAGVLLVYTPQFNRQNPIKAFAQAVRVQVEPGNAVYVCGPTNDLALSFNLGRFLPSLPAEADIVRYLSSGDRGYCLMDGRLYARISELTGRRFPVLAHQEFERSALLLVSRQP